jgi:hypothetical protein
MGSHRYSRNLDDGCGFDVSAFWGSATRFPRGTRRNPHEKQESRRLVENIGDGLLDGHDAQPVINVAAFSDQRVSR